MKWAYALELRHSSFRVVAPILIAVSLYFGVTNSFPQVASWANLETVVQANSLFWAPFLAALGAWEGQRTIRRRMWQLESVASREEWMVRLPQYLATLTYTLGAHVVSTLVLGIRANLIGVYDSPDAASLLRSALVQVFALTLGFAIAELLRTWLAIVLAVSVVVVLQAFEFVPSMFPVLSSLNPMHSFSPVSMGSPNGTYFGGQSVLVLGLILLLWALATTAHRGRRSGRDSLGWTASFGLLGVGFAFLGGGIVISTGGVDTVVPERDSLAWVVVELPESGARLHVTAQFAPVSRELSETWDRVGVLLGKSELAFDELRQDVAPDYGDAARGEFYRLDLDPHSRDIAGKSLEIALYDLSPCTFGGEIGAGNWSLEGNLVFSTWLQGRSEFGSNAAIGSSDILSALRTLELKSASEAQEWVASHAENIKGCAWDRSDFS